MQTLIITTKSTAYSCHSHYIVLTITFSVLITSRWLCKYSPPLCGCSRVLLCSLTYLWHTTAITGVSDGGGGLLLLYLVPAAMVVWLWGWAAGAWCASWLPDGKSHTGERRRIWMELLLLLLWLNSYVRTCVHHMKHKYTQTHIHS